MNQTSKHVLLGTVLGIAISGIFALGAFFSRNPLHISIGEPHQATVAPVAIQPIPTTTDTPPIDSVLVETGTTEQGTADEQEDYADYLKQKQQADYIVIEDPDERHAAEDVAGQERTYAPGLPADGE